ncbi:T4 family baseplate hub assembly chaperone [Geodermatophilus sp. URMC 62]|uniref:T4 family baseplate hub assembly chaperone n=1 Tax=Geodermatophilus sp. URMC 62 TaxID=3423414 RepID=UPI00406C60DB
MPGGIWGDGPEPVRSVHLRAVGSEDHAFLLDTAGVCAAGQRGTALLARCIQEDDAGTLARSLTVGDREALLLQLRRITLGDAFECVLRCPGSACGEPMELQLAISRLLVPPYPEVRREYRLLREVDGVCEVVRFRLPTACDLDAVGFLAAVDADLAAAQILRACVTEARRDGRTVPVEVLGPGAAAKIAADMAERDPQAELQFDGVCPVCGHAFEFLFDTGSFLLEELDARTTQLLYDVHVLALNYHWTEQDILAMSPGRRERYLGLLAGGNPDLRAQVRTAT